MNFLNDDIKLIISEFLDHFRLLIREQEGDYRRNPSIFLREWCDMLMAKVSLTSAPLT